MSQWNSWLHGSYRQARRVVIAVVGFTVLAVGIVLLVTPGPAFVVIPIGLGILAVEFAWARRWLLKIKEKAKDAADRWNGKETSREEPTESDAGLESMAQPEVDSASSPSSSPPDQTACEKNGSPLSAKEADLR